MHTYQCLEQSLGAGGAPHSFKLFLKGILLGDCKCTLLTEEQRELANSLCNPPMMGMG